MVNQQDLVIIDKAKMPAGKVIGQYTFLRDAGKKLADNKAILVKAADAPEAKKIQSRWRAYFKGNAHSRKEVSPDGKITVYLWLEK